ncbi:prostasin, partial [Nephila pilipes]
PSNPSLSSNPSNPSLPSSPSNPLHVGVGSVSVLEDPLSHVDPAPIPIRNGRPLLLQDSPPQRGEVASSIMSSVSLVVRPPANSSKNRTSGHLDRDEHPFRHSPKKKEQASYRFLDEGIVGEGLVRLEPEPLEGKDSSGSVKEELISGDISLVRNASVKESSGEYLSESGSTSNEFSSPEALQSISSTESARLKESAVEYVSVNEESLSTSSEFLSNEAAEEISVSLLMNTSISESSVEYVNSETTEELFSTEIQSVDNITDSSDYEEFTKQDGNFTVSDASEDLPTDFIIQLSPNSSKTTNNDEVISLNSTDMIREISEPYNETELIVRDVFHIYSAKSDVGLNYQNYSSEKSNISLDEVGKSTTTQSTSQSESEEAYNSNSEVTNSFVHTRYINAEQNATESLLNSFSKHGNVSDDITTDFPFIFRTDESSEYDPMNSDFFTSTVEFANSFEDSTLFETPESPTSTEFKDQNSTEEVTNKSETRPAILDYNSFGFHTQKGHGFHIPPQKDSSENNSSPTEDTTKISSPTEFSLKFKPSENSLEPFTSTSSIGEEQNETDNETFSELQTTRTVSTVSDEFSLQTTITAPTTSNALNDSFVPKIVPQQSDLSFDANDIDENHGSDEDQSDVDPLGVEIIRHITTLPPTPVSLGKHPVFVSETCAEDEFQCASGECVDAAGRCNMRRDCRDNSDEKKCTCSQLLKVMGQSQKICDGVEDCDDHSDEQNCPWCEEGQVVCPQNKFCINQSQVCDGHNDCPSGVDERYCVKLAENAGDALGLHYRAYGFLMVRKEGSWGKLCLDNLHDSRALRLKLDELGEAVCSALTFRSVSESQRTHDTKDSNDTYYVISNQVPTHNKRSSAIFRTSECNSRQVMRVQCGDLECGLRPMSSGPRRRIVGGQSAGAGSWPWQVALYKEGDFQCGAVLISDTWLISAGHCFFSTQSAYWVARLGLLRRGTELTAPSEQVRRVIQIFLHPEYEDKGFINDIALLRMDRPVLFSDYLRPVCLPTVQEDAGLWHGRHCSVVGWGKLYEIGHTFPDSLQEVRLPVISTEECRKRILFLTMYHITDNMFCAGYERGGRDACLGDSGGPLMCQREDGRWILLGVTSNGDGCGRPKRPGVYTKVANYLAWIKQVTEAKHVVLPSPDRCEGVRCMLGRCVAPYKLCDGQWDCSEGKDEDHCLE